MTNCRYVLTVAASVAVWLHAASAAGEPSEAFANSLMSEGDYFRAVTVLKQLAFEAATPQQKAVYRYRIADAYRLSQRWELAVANISPLLARGALAPELVPRAHLQLGLSYLGMGVTAMAEPEFERAAAMGEVGRARLFQGLVRLEARRDREAAELFALAARDADPAVAGLAATLAERALRVGSIPSKSPAVAATLSAIVPGAGQLYVGHEVDALQAFGFTSTFGFATYLAYDRDRRQGGPFVLTGIAAAITAVFHAANIYGATRTALYFNERQREIFLRDTRQAALSVSF